MVGGNDGHANAGGVAAMMREDMGGCEGETASCVSLTGFRDDVVAWDPYVCVLNRLDEVLCGDDVDAFRGNERSYARDGLA